MEQVELKKLFKDWNSVNKRLRGLFKMLRESSNSDGKPPVVVEKVASPSELSEPEKQAEPQPQPASEPVWSVSE